MGLWVRSALRGLPNLGGAAMLNAAKGADAGGTELLNRHWRQHALQRYDGMWFRKPNTGSSNDLFHALRLFGRRLFCHCRIHCRWGRRRFSSEPGINQRFGVFVLGAALHLLRQNPRPSRQAELLLRASPGILGLRAL